MPAPDRGVPLALTALLALVALATVATAALAQGGPVRYRDPVFQQVQRTNDIIYGQATDIPTGQPVQLRLDLYQPQGDSEPARPVLVFIHGGGFTGGDKSNGQRWAEEFARRGWVAVSIGYRLNQGNTATVGIPAAVSDARQALRWLRTVAATYRLDLDRVVVSGSSAGAITSLFLTYTEVEKTPADADVRVAGVMDLWGGLYGQEGEMTAGEPPLIIVHGTEDTVVPYRNAVALRDRAEAVGIPYAFHPLAGVGHGANQLSAQISAWTAEFLYPLLWPASGAATATMVPTLGPTTATPRTPTATRRPPGTPNPTPTVGPNPAGAPNIVFVLTDDLDLELDTMDYTPNIQRLLADAGTTLDGFYLTYPLCCPSRTTILRGQYLHNHGVTTNKPPVGGYEKFLAVGNEDSTVGTWLQAAGYRTVFIGKYLNGYPVAGDLRHVPAGWTEWISPAAGNPYSSYRYTLNDNGRLVVYGSAPEDHITDVIAGKAEASIRRAGSDGRPFFIHIAPYAPHAPADPAPRHASLFPDAQVQRVPSFNEADVSDKPARIQGLELLKPRAIATLDANYRKRLQSMQAVDEMVARLVTALDETGELANTYFVFTSDNGYHMGHHRLAAGKTTAYEEDIHAPFIVRGPGVPAGRTVRGFLAGNVDLAPTFAEMAGVTPPEYVDGRSLASLLVDAPDLLAWRQAYLVEGYAGGGRTGTETPTPTVVAAGAEDPALGLLEPPDAFDLAEERALGRPAQEEPGEDDGTEVYVALRTRRYTYVEWKQTGERELYDNEVDPYQLENLAARVPTAWLDILSERANALHACAGAECRELEARPIELPDVTPGTPGLATATPKPATATRPPATRTATSTPHPDHLTLYLPLVGRAWRVADLALPPTAAPPTATTAPTAVPGTINGCDADHLDLCNYRPATWVAASAVRALQGYTVTNTAEGRALPIVVRAATGVSGARPVVVWSHGGGPQDEATLAMNREWATALARAGYIVVQPAHVSPDVPALCAKLGVTDPAECAAVQWMTWYRPSDARAVLDALPAVATAFPQLAGRVDLTRVAYAGHSFGAFTSMAVAGARVDYAPGYMDVSWVHPQPRAFLALSPQGPGRFGFHDTSWRDITRPVLTASGAGDTTSEGPAGEQAEDRREPFRRMPPGDKHELWLASPDAIHATFNLGDTGPGARFHEAIVMTGLAFLDAYVLDQAPAKAWLASSNVVVLTAGAAEWGRR